MADLCPNGGRPIAIDYQGNHICPEYVHGRRTFKDGGSVKLGTSKMDDDGIYQHGGYMECIWTDGTVERKTCHGYNGNEDSGHYGGGCAQKFSACLSNGGIPEYLHYKHVVKGKI
tara:strand:+ start:394 stop:738 length:345 start_codon:yes stop_codon:yes gene_type:complete